MLKLTSDPTTNACSRWGAKRLHTGTQWLWLTAMGISVKTHTLPVHCKPSMQVADLRSLLLLCIWLLHHRSRQSGTLRVSFPSPSLCNPQRLERCTTRLNRQEGSRNLCTVLAACSAFKCPACVRTRAWLTIVPWLANHMVRIEEQLLHAQPADWLSGWRKSGALHATHSTVKAVAGLS